MISISITASSSWLWDKSLPIVRFMLGGVSSFLGFRELEMITMLSGDSVFWEVPSNLFKGLSLISFSFLFCGGLF